PREPGLRAGGARLSALRADRTGRRHRDGRLAQPVDRCPRAHLRRRRLRRQRPAPPPRVLGGHSRGVPASRGHLRGQRRLHRGCAVKTRGGSRVLSLCVRARRKPGRGDHGRLFRLRPRLRAGRLDGGRARPWAVLGREDDRELPHVRHSGRLCRAMSDRFEVLPFGRAEEEAARLTEHVRLTVTASPTHTLDQTVATGTRLRALGHEVTVHLAARMIRDRAHLDALLDEMSEAGIDDAFVIGGDATPPAGPYASAVELLPLVHEHPQRPRAVGIAGYPEGHPLIDSATLAGALREKSTLADYVTTQLCFDPDALVRWVQETREAGISLPVILGVPGIVD